MDFLCNLPAAQLSANWKNLEFLENFGSRSCYVSQLHKIFQLPQLHKNLTIPAAAHGAAYSQLHRKFDMAPAPLRERRALLARARDTIGKFWSGNFWKKIYWKGLEELEKFGIQTSNV